MEDFASFFLKATGFQPYGWQEHIAKGGFCDVLPVPTGLGKTEGAVLAWAWRYLNGKGEPRHLVYCLPMRVLVRQTVDRVRFCFENAGIDIPVFELMGGMTAEERDDQWVSLPEKPWVLVGTQDQLLSRALNRGYTTSRFQWPIHFGLLNNDCRWIVDEVQLMGPGLWTTAQLDWMRRSRFGTVFPCLTTWMSATVGGNFLATHDRKKDKLDTPTPLDPSIIEKDQSDEIRRRLAARRPIEMWSPSGKPGAPQTRGAARENESSTQPDFLRKLAKDIVSQHVRGTLSLVVCNTVETATALFEALPDDPPKVLLTSRFRRQDREANEKKLLDFEARRKKVEMQRHQEGRSEESGKPLPGDPGLICVSTQVVEAGLDISAHRLWSAVAPFPSVIQRLGRLNRDGRDQEAKAWFWMLPPSDKTKDQQEGPYEEDDLKKARLLLEELIPLTKNKAFSDALKELNNRVWVFKGESLRVCDALQPKEQPMPRALEVHSLFSTEPDVHGGFTDISAFVRGTDSNADLYVVWRDWKGGKQQRPPQGDELSGPPLDVAKEACPVPVHRLRSFLEKAAAAAWIWSEESDGWERVPLHELRAGMVVMLHREAGGYSSQLGWTGKPTDTLVDLPPAGRGRTLRDEPRTELGCWVSLQAHLEDARAQAEELCKALGLERQLAEAVIQAAALHDLGKAHPLWQSALPAPASQGAGEWAKCPYVVAVEAAAPEAWQAVTAAIKKLRPQALPLFGKRFGDANNRRCWALDQPLSRHELEQLRGLPHVRRANPVPFRPGLRHEAATALAMWHRYWEQENAAYPALAVYLAAAHHGKVRTVFRAITEEGNDAFGVPPQPEFLEHNGQRWPLDFTVTLDGAAGDWDQGQFLLRGVGWTGLVADLLGPWQQSTEDPSEAGVVPENEPRKLGPFQLAYLEALVRIADWRASASPSSSIKLGEVSRDSW